MGRMTWFSRALLGLSAAACFLTAPAFAAEPFDNDELVAGSEFLALPDKNTHSGVFLDLIAFGSSSVTGPNVFGIAAPAESTSLRVAIFDGNTGGLWDQNRIENDANGNPIPDGSVVEYDLVTASPTAPETIVAIGDSENATPRPGAAIFSYAVDGRWQFLFDGPHHPNAQLPDGRHVYRLLVRYRQPTPSGSNIAPINGYKVAINAPFGLIPFQVGQLLTGGFIGGVVDSRNMLFTFPGSPAGGDEYSVSRDHYPDLLEPSANLNSILNGPAAALPAVRFPSPDPFVNTYNGSFELGIRLIPNPGQSWVNFVENLILEEGDADDVDDLSGISPEGMPSPSNAGIPPDDGRAYLDQRGVAHDNSGYRLPFAAQPSDAGSPWLELVDPNGVVRVTLLDLSGNVAQEDNTGAAFEKIPVPLDGIPGLWTLRMHNLDARNSWFLRANVEFNPLTQSLEGRVYRDLNCDGDDEVDTEPALTGLTVRIQRTDVPADPIFRVTDTNGFYSVNPIPAGSYNDLGRLGRAEHDVGDRPAPVEDGGRFGQPQGRRHRLLREDLRLRRVGPPPRGVLRGQRVARRPDDHVVRRLRPARQGLRVRPADGGPRLLRLRRGLPRRADRPQRRPEGQEPQGRRRLRQGPRVRHGRPGLVPDGLLRRRDEADGGRQLRRRGRLRRVLLQVAQDRRDLPGRLEAALVR